MTASFLADEHVPSVFISTLRSNGYEVETAKDVLEEGARDVELLNWAAENGLVLLTHDKKDFGGQVGGEIDHAGIVIYTDPVFLHRSPEMTVHLLEQVLEHYSADEIAGSRIWLDQWRRT